MTRALGGNIPVVVNNDIRLGVAARGVHVETVTHKRYRSRQGPVSTDLRHTEKTRRSHQIARRTRISTWPTGAQDHWFMGCVLHGSAPVIAESPKQVLNSSPDGGRKVVVAGQCRHLPGTESFPNHVQVTCARFSLLLRDGHYTRDDVLTYTPLDKLRKCGRTVPEPHQDHETQAPRIPPIIRTSPPADSHEARRPYHNPGHNGYQDTLAYPRHEAELVH